MATGFGITELRSKLDDWRANWKIYPPSAAIPWRRRKTKSEDREKSSRAANELSVLIENLIIPKLVADSDEQLEATDYDLGRRAGETAKQLEFNKVDVQAFAEMCARDDAKAILAFVDERINKGYSIDTIFVNLLAPSARRLGELWEDDHGDFVDVTMGLWRIQEVLRELTLRIPPDAGTGFGQRSALFSTMPKDQHSLGTLMIAECFYRAGWDTDILVEPTQSELISKFANRHYDLIGLTASCDHPKASFSTLVSAVRSVSTNSETRIMLGGRVINENPSWVEECGADGTAVDAPSAVLVAESLVPVKHNMFEKLV